MVFCVVCLSESDYVVWFPDVPAKTSTGTIAIGVVDSNDHCPFLTTPYAFECTDQKTVLVSGLDEDQKPNSAPLSFTIVSASRGEWDIEMVNGKGPWWT